jgi:hypothetical protein
LPPKSRPNRKWISSRIDAATGGQEKVGDARPIRISSAAAADVSAIIKNPRTCQGASFIVLTAMVNRSSRFDFYCDKSPTTSWQLAGADGPGHPMDRSPHHPLHYTPAFAEAKTGG